MPARRQTRSANKPAKLRAQKALLRSYERLARRRQCPRYVFTLYVTGGSVHSLAAIRNLHTLRERHLPDAEINIVDILRHPTLAGAAQVLASPTLVKSSPLPVRRFVGDLSDTQKLLRGLGIETAVSKKLDV